MIPTRFVLLTVFAMLAATLSGCEQLNSMRELQKIETKLKDAGYANISVKSSSQTKNKTTTYTITTTVDRPRNPPFDQKLGTEVAQIVIMNYPKVKDLDNITVELKGSGSNTTQTRPPSEWMDLVRDFREPPGIRSAVLSKGVKGDDFEAVDPTKDFPAEQSVFHAVIAVKNLPQDTPVKAVWTAVDTHGAAPENQKIVETDAKASGTARLHFTMEPNGGKLPKGAYKLEVNWDNKVQGTLPFTVAGG